jgi:hypothetical protein
MSNSYIEQIDANVFYRTNNIGSLNLSYTRIRHLNSNAFAGMHNIKAIDLRRNYISRVNRSTFQHLLADESGDAQNAVEIYLENNPVHCDCNLNWILDGNNTFMGSVYLPEICAGPFGYDCLSINDYNQIKANCTPEIPTDAVQLPCDRLVFPSIRIPEENLDSSVTVMANILVDYEDESNTDFEMYSTTTQVVNNNWNDLTVTDKKPPSSSSKSKNNKDLIQLHVSSLSNKNSSKFINTTCFLFFIVHTMFSYIYVN